MYGHLVLNKMNDKAAKKELAGKGKKNKAFGSAAPETLSQFSRFDLFGSEGARNAAPEALSLYKTYAEQIRQLSERIRRDCKYGGVYVEFMPLKTIIDTLKDVKPTNKEERKELKEAINDLIKTANELKIPIVMEKAQLHREVGFGGETKMKTTKEDLGKQLSKIVSALES